MARDDRTPPRQPLWPLRSARWLGEIAAFLARRDPTGRRDVARKVRYLEQRGKWARSLGRRSAKVDAIPIDRPIFFLGVQGAGLTIVARTLVRSGNVCTASGNAANWAQTLDELGLDRARRRRLPTDLWHAQERTDAPPDAIFGVEHGNAYATDRLLERYRRTADDATGEDAEAFRRVIREHILVYAPDPAHARFADKTQTYTVKAGYIAKLLEGCDPHFVLVTRNPYSMSYRAAVRDYAHVEIGHEARVRLAAEHWENSYRLALQDGEELDRFSVVRFEDFVEDPISIVRDLCAFVDLPFDEELVPQPHHTLPPGTYPVGDAKWYPLRPDSWLPRVGEQDAAIIAERCGTLAERFGYSPAAVS
jgi:hypothetical protein